MAVSLEVPSIGLLPDYVDALERGWSADNVRGKLAADEELARIADDPRAFVASLDDPEGRGPPIRLADGSQIPRLCSTRRWVWDEGFCGSIGLRWSPGGSELPSWFPYGHIGYAVPPWRQGLGHATRALALVLPLAREVGLTWVELTTQAENPASQRVVAKNGGRVVARQPGDANHGGGDILRWRIEL